MRYFCVGVISLLTTVNIVKAKAIDLHKELKSKTYVEQATFIPTKNGHGQGEYKISVGPYAIRGAYSSNHYGTNHNAKLVLKQNSDKQRRGNRALVKRIYHELILLVDKKL